MVVRQIGEGTMSVQDVAQSVLESIGGKSNLLSSMLCMTRLRLNVADPSLIDREDLNDIPGVLGCVGRGSNGIEVVFGPNLVASVYQAFCERAGTMPAVEGTLSVAGGREGKLSVHLSPGSSSVPPRAISAARTEQTASDPGSSEMDVLTRLLQMGEAAEEERLEGEGKGVDGPRLLVLNGPNINMLGVREPELYGRADYAALLELCRSCAAEEGFSDCVCYQSNHEGDLVDQIQDAYQNFDGIIINPAAYTHTSIALLDALKAVSIPAIEVHISKVDEREEFRKVSYVRKACFETISGLGIKGYAMAIRDMASHLRREEG